MTLVKKKRRPVVRYSDERVDTILERISKGERLTEICRVPGLPSRESFNTWVNRSPELLNVTVDNPYNRLDRIAVNVSVKESAITTLAVRGHIDACQARAAVRFRALWEAAGSRLSGIDPEAVRVDGGNLNDFNTDGRLVAMQQLAGCRHVLGARVYGIMVKVAGEGYGIRDLGNTHRERIMISDYLKNGLDDLARHWGYKN